MLLTRDVARRVSATLQNDNYQAFRDWGNGHYQAGLRVTAQPDGSALVSHWPDFKRTERVRWVLWHIGQSLVCRGFAVELRYPQPEELEFSTTLPASDFPINPVLLVRDIPRSFRCERCGRVGSVQEMRPGEVCQECEYTQVRSHQKNGVA